MITINPPPKLKKLDLLKVIFDTEIQAAEIINFRGALVEKIGREHEWFHNHANQEVGKRFHYRYPLVQYKRFARHPMLIFLGESMVEAQHFFSLPSWDLRINDRFHSMNIKEMQQRSFNLKVYPKQFHYKLYNWQALNQENHNKWSRIGSLVKRVQELERILVAHVISFARGVDWRIEGRVNLEINDVLSQKNIRYKGFYAQTFDISFTANVLLPEFIGLGKGTSRGFGIVRLDRKKRQNYGI